MKFEDDAERSKVKVTEAKEQNMHFIATVTEETNYFDFPLTRSQTNLVETFLGGSYRSSSKMTLIGQRSRSQG